MGDCAVSRRGLRELGPAADLAAPAQMRCRRFLNSGTDPFTVVENALRAVCLENTGGLRDGGGRLAQLFNENR